MSSQTLRTEKGGEEKKDSPRSGKGTPGELSVFAAAIRAENIRGWLIFHEELGTLFLPLSRTDAKWSKMQNPRIDGSIAVRESWEMDAFASSMGERALSIIAYYDAGWKGIISISISSIPLSLLSPFIFSFSGWWKSWKVQIAKRASRLACWAPLNLSLHIYIGSNWSCSTCTVSSFPLGNSLYPTRREIVVACNETDAYLPERERMEETAKREESPLWNVERT